MPHRNLPHRDRFQAPRGRPSLIAEFLEEGGELGGGGVAFGFYLVEWDGVLVPPVLHRIDDVLAMGGDIAIKVGGEVVLGQPEYEIPFVVAGEFGAGLAEFGDKLPVE
jgi:hypothetical protein